MPKIILTTGTKVTTQLPKTTNTKSFVEIDGDEFTGTKQPTLQVKIWIITSLQRGYSAITFETLGHW